MSCQKHLHLSILLNRADGSITVYRLIVEDKVEWQKLFSIDGGSGTVSSLRWRPDGRVVVAGREDGRVELINVERGEVCVKHTNAQTSLAASVSSLQWVQGLEDMLTAHNNYYSDRAGRYLFPINTSTSESSSMFSDQGKGGRTGEAHNANDVLRLCSDNGAVLPLHMVIGSDGSGKICLLSQGHYSIATVNLASGSKVVEAHLSVDLGMLTVLVKSNPTTHVVHTIPSTLLKVHKSEVSYLCYQIDVINRLIDFAHHTIRQMLSVLRESVKPIESKFEALCQLNKRYDKDTSPKTEFFHLFASGVASPALIHFLSRDLTEQHIKRIHKGFEVTCQKIHKLTFEQLIGCAEAILFRVADARGLAHRVDSFQALGWTTETCDALVNAAEVFKVKVDEVSHEVREMTANTDAFLKWLMVTVPKVTSEGGVAPIPGDLPLQVDVRRVRKVLMSPEGDRSSYTQMGSFLHSSLFLQFENRPIPNDAAAKNSTLSSLVAATTAPRDFFPNDMWYGSLPSTHGLFSTLSLQMQYENLKGAWNDALKKVSEAVTASIKSSQYLYNPVTVSSVQHNGPDAIIKVHNRVIAEGEESKSYQIIAATNGNGKITFCRISTPSVESSQLGEEELTPIYEVATLSLPNTGKNVLHMEFCGEVVGSGVAAGRRIDEMIGVLSSGEYMEGLGVEGEENSDNKGEATVSSLHFYEYDSLEWSVVDDSIVVDDGILTLQSKVTPQELPVSNQVYHIKNTDITGLSISTRGLACVHTRGGNVVLFDLME
jgi:hypothetical protein